MEFKRNVYVDLIYHIFAHIKLDNAADTYDEKYIEHMEKVLQKKTIIPVEMKAYYRTHFDRLAFVNFLPYFMMNSVDEVVYLLGHTGMTGEEDMVSFINPLCEVIRDIENSYVSYWEQNGKRQEAVLEQTKEYFQKQNDKLIHFFEKVNGNGRRKVCVLFSESMRKNGRGMGMQDAYYVILPVPDENLSAEDLYLQFVHECTHTLTDTLLGEIRMDDGSHDIAEYQVILYDLWLMQRDCEELVQKYTDWVTQELLDISEKNLPFEQKNRLRKLLVE